MSPPEYRRTDVQTLRCDRAVGGCGEVYRARVSIHRLSGVAGATCTRCGKTQEPLPVRDRDRDRDRD